MAQQNDLIAYQDDVGTNIVLARTNRGLDWIVKFMPTGECQGSFGALLGRIPPTLRVGVLDPERKTYNIVSTPLH